MLWSPSPQFIEQSNLKRFTNWLTTRKNLSFKSYDELWSWSTSHLEDFWECILQYFDVVYEGNYSSVLSGQQPYNASWFDGIRLNYAEHIFRTYTDAHPAIIFKGESRAIQEISWRELYNQTASLQHYFKTWNISSADAIVAYLPCIPEATVGLLAAASLGSTWASCSPDFGTAAVIDRFTQLKPKVLIATRHYTYGGKSFDKLEVLEELIKNLPSLQHVILVSEDIPPLPGIETKRWKDVSEELNKKIDFAYVPFSHPLWVLYSSGTTGLPKAFVHSQGGILLEQLKYGSFHNDFKPGERCFWYTTTGWMMWNYIHGSLLAGATMVIYDGSVAYPDLKALWKFATDAGINHFGTSAAYVLANMKEDLHPAEDFDLSKLHSIS